MRQARRFARSGVGLAVVVAAAGCVTAEPVRDAHRRPLSAAEVARREITARIERTVDATKRHDVDALARAREHVPRADGSRMSFAEARAEVANQLDGIERTVSLVVRVDSLRMTSDSAALVYTMQRWERVLVAADGGRHRALTQNWLEQRWARSTGDGWHGVGDVHETRPGTAMLDGVPLVVVEGAPPD